MISNLRDRRRKQTAKEIQLATLRLCLEFGYAAVTTDSIAAAAGISPRTFFNYYPNKQAAVLGPPPTLDCCAADWIVSSNAPLIADLTRLLGHMLQVKEMDRRSVRMIEQIWDSTPELMAMFRNSMDNIALTIAELLQRRFGPEQEAVAMLIAELATHSLFHAVRTWAADETMTEDDISRMIDQQLRQVGALLN